MLSLGTASCGLLESAGTTTDGVARSWASSVDDVPRREAKLRGANGGSATMDKAIGEQLKARPGVLDDLWKETSEVRGLACQAYSQNADQITSPSANPLTALHAQSLLNRMRADTAQERVAAETLRIACEIAGLEL